MYNHLLSLMYQSHAEKANVVAKECLGRGCWGKYLV